MGSIRTTSGKSPAIDRLAKRLKSGKNRAVAISGVGRGLRGHTLSALVQRGVERFVCVTASEDGAEELADELRLFLGHASVGDTDPVLELTQEPLTPYDLPASRAKERAAERLKTLSYIARGAPWTALVLSAPALVRKCIPRESLVCARESIRTGEVVDRDEFLRQLAQMGFSNAPLVEDPGSFAVRGGIVDVFSPMASCPARIEFFGDEVESIRLFDPETQRAFRLEKELKLSAAKELVLSEDKRDRGTELVLKLSDTTPIASADLSALIDDIQRGFLPSLFSGIVPGFFEHGLESIFDYVAKDDPTFFIDDPLAVDEALAAEEASVATAYEGALLRNELALPPKDHVLSRGEILAHLQNFPVIRSEQLMVDEGSGANRIQFPASAWRFSKAFEAAPKESQAKEAHFSEGFHEVGSASGEEAPGDSEAAEVFQQASEQLRQVHAPEDNLQRWAAAFREKSDQGFYVALTAGSQAQAEKLKRLFEGRDLATAIVPGPIPHLARDTEATSHFQVHIHLGELWGSFVDEDSKVAVATDRDVLGKRPRATAKAFGKKNTKKSADKAFIQVFQNMKVGDLVVHDDYGVGRYEGLQRMKFGEMVCDVMVIQYAGNDRVYLPVARLRRIQKFNGAKAGETPLDRLGSVSWEKRKKAVKENLLRMAADLLKVEAIRRAHPGHAFVKGGDEMTRFEAAFAFDETPDQLQAIESVLKDMRSTTPMDRLICGDVGFGKTEVAMRAAFQAVLNQKQVIVLVPTTVLAFQHLESFRKRFSEEPVRIEMISRLRTPKQNEAVKQAIREGKVDIVIGTHALLASDMEFPNAGLLIVDEEHRFGVTHKEKIKRLKQNLDVLTLTATPIPRTLNLALSGLRQMSLIATPPVDRKPIRTFIIKEDEGKVSEVIRRELDRGGQVFFVHNRVETLAAKRDELQKLVPSARFAIAHGQMDKGDLERVMGEFSQRHVDVLVCSSIIESGLDIPNANTIAVERADTFGLSQLYQIRGRVGRGNERAYAYLMIPKVMPLNREARMRLEALQSFTELGAGFHIAARDLEIRGAGNLLGKDQSGQVAAVGFDLYCRLLDESVSELLGEPPREDFEPDIDLPIPAYFPEDYLPDIGMRLSFYKRMSEAQDESELLEIRMELKDRFGPMNQETDNLFELMALKTRLRTNRLKSLHCTPKGMVLALSDDAHLDPFKLIHYVQTHPQGRRLTPQMKLIAGFSVAAPLPLEMFQDCHRLIDDVEGLKANPQSR